MSTEVKKESRSRSRTVLFINIVGYPKLLIDDLAHWENTVLMAMGKEPQRRYARWSSSPKISCAANPDQPTRSVQIVPNDRLDPIFDAVVQATEKAIVNALVDQNVGAVSNDVWEQRDKATGSRYYVGRESTNQLIPKAQRLRQSTPRQAFSAGKSRHGRYL